MIWIKPYQVIELENECGAIFWNYEDDGLYGVSMKGVSTYPTRRYIRKLTDFSEDIVANIHFPTDVNKDANTLSSEFFSGELGVLVNRRFTVSGQTRTIPCIYWFPWGSGMPTGFSHLYGGTSNFVRVKKTGGSYTFHFCDSDGNFARWDSAWGPADTPENKNQVVPWRGEYGNIRSLSWQTAPETEVVTERFLVIANPTGAVRWVDMHKWMTGTPVMPIYKQVGLLQCKSLRDITVDRVNNILWVLEDGKRLLQFNMEPFGDEAEDYENTPQAIKVWTEDEEIAAGAETNCYGQFYDMWGQKIERSDIPTDFIAGGGLGKFYDPESDEYKVSLRTFTNDDGIASATYKANGGISDD